MSGAVICDCCGKAMFTDSRSDKDAYATINIDYCRNFMRVHLCKDCYKKAAKEYFGEEEEE